MANWNSTGYDLSRSTRWIYVFSSATERRVKVGLVLTEGRLNGRLREVARKHPDVDQVALSPLHDHTHQEAEHVEAVVRHWLCSVAGFAHSGLVDWLDVPEPAPADWQQLLDQAVHGSLMFRSWYGTATTGVGANPLPSLASFSDDEQLVARFVIGAIRSGGTMFEGRIYECHISALLGGDLAPRGVWPWDVRLRDRPNPDDCTKLEIRSSAGSFAVDGGRDAHVWVLVRKNPTYASGSTPDGYFVAPNHRIVELRRAAASLSPRRATEVGLPFCGDSDLGACVAVASQDERNWRDRDTVPDNRR